MTPLSFVGRAPLAPRATPRMAANDDALRWVEANVGAIESSSSAGGSGWASFRRVKAGGRELFIKTSSRPSDVMFLGEAVGLRAMHATESVVVPEVLAFGDGDGGGSYLIMQYLEFGGRADPREFGRKMAQMHLAPCAQAEAAAGKFGFDVPNSAPAGSNPSPPRANPPRALPSAAREPTALGSPPAAAIGGTPQPNTWSTGSSTADWVDFFREQRIGHQVRTAADPRMSKEWQAVLAATGGLHDLFEGLTITPSVLHGDLWSGNVACVDGAPAIFDPATYYGHHEAEWGMSWCASFPPAFWEGYRELIPEEPGFRRREPLYELYHILNHHNLFGGGYGGQSLSLMGRLQAGHGA